MRRLVYPEFRKSQQATQLYRCAQSLQGIARVPHPRFLRVGFSAHESAISYFPFRCRTASNKTTPAATETFSDFTGPTVGNDTTKSHRFRVSSCNPLPSPPRTIPTGDV